ncbi:hypothetical protein MRY82_08260 [bacterium]|nr:hypothetical protein [bacterium]
MKNNYNKKKNLVFFLSILFSSFVYAQTVSQYWDSFQANQMNSEISGDQIKLCMTLKMLVLPEAKKNTDYLRDVSASGNVFRYMRSHCQAKYFNRYLELLDDLQKDILITQKILKKDFSKNWTMKSLQKTFTDYWRADPQYDLNCYAKNIKLNVEQKYILYLAITELKHKFFLGLEVNGSSQRQIILKLYERVYGLKKKIDKKYQLDPELAKMILELKEEALLEAKDHHLIHEALINELIAKVLRSRSNIIE